MTYVVFTVHNSLLAKDLVTHLLCVDPAQRYTIDEFLAHPWCNEAPAPPPPPTPHVAPLLNRAIDSPLLASLRGGREARSPGLHTLKEAFDVTYAVHRMEEEGAWRRHRGAGNRFLHGLNEDEEATSLDNRVVQEARRREQAVHDPRRTEARIGDRSKPRNPLEEGRAGVRDQSARRHGNNVNKPFELDIDNATLLGRRHKQGTRAGVGVSPLARQALDKEQRLYEIPGSPMHVG